MDNNAKFNIQELSYEIAERLYSWMSIQKSQCTESNEFLPADVCCDFVGMQRFKVGMANIIENSLRGVL